MSGKHLWILEWKVCRSPVLASAKTLRFNIPWTSAGNSDVFSSLMYSRSKRFETSSRWGRGFLILLVNHSYRSGSFWFTVLSRGSRYLYLMTTNFSEKQHWVAALEAAVRSVQRQDRLSKSVRSLSPWVSVTMDWKSLSLWTVLNDLGHYGSGDRNWGWVLCWHGVPLN